MFHKTFLSAAAGLALVLPVLAQEPGAAEAQDAPAAQEPKVSQAAQEILKNVPKLLDQKWKTTMLFDVKSEEGTANVKATLHYQDFRHFKADLKIDAVEGEEVTKMAVQIVCDGKFVYLDGDIPVEQTGGLPLPIKIDIGVVEGLIKSQSLAA
jgi:hypothetical protein